MKDNGTDRDVAQLMLSLLNNIATSLSAINDSLYAPHITSQPTDQTVAIGSTCTFTITADHVKSYQWQYQSGSSWLNSVTTQSYSFTVAEVHYRMSFRCVVTGLDGTTVISDVVKPIEPAQG